MHPNVISLLSQSRSHILWDEWSCEVDEIASIRVGLSFHRYLRLFPCDPFLNSFELVLDLDVVRSLKVWRFFVLPVES